VRFPSLRRAEIVIAAATSATAIGAITVEMFMDSQLLSVRAESTQRVWIVRS